jgi:hypothetical protein
MYWKYLKYVIRHKWYVFKACFKMGIIWRGIIHDLSKFRPSEFIPYARFFYGNGNNIKSRRDNSGFYKPYDTGDRNFDFAWLLHQKRNKHHWQWWILPLDDGGIKKIEMDIIDVKEMIADWIGAGMAISGRKDPWDWYIVNNNKIQLNEKTKIIVEKVLEEIHIHDNVNKKEFSKILQRLQKREELEHNKKIFKKLIEEKINGKT